MWVSKTCCDACKLSFKHLGLDKINPGTRFRSKNTIFEALGKGTADYTAVCSRKTRCTKSTEGYTVRHTPVCPDRVSGSKHTVRYTAVYQTVYCSPPLVPLFCVLHGRALAVCFLKNLNESWNVIFWTSFDLYNLILLNFFQNQSQNWFSTSLTSIQYMYMSITHT